MRLSWNDKGYTRWPHYSCGQKIQVGVFIQALMGTFFLLIVVFAALGLVVDLVTGQVARAESDCAYFGFLLFALLPLYSGCVQGIHVAIKPRGIGVQTCYLGDFFVPWEDVIDVRVTSRLRTREFPFPYVEQSRVLVKGGLTILHGGHLNRIGKRWRWLRGFNISSEGIGYKDLVKAIQEHTASNQEQQNHLQE